MKRTNYLRWFRRLAILGAIVAGVTASSAAAVPMLDGGGTPAVGHTTALGVRADGLRWQAIAKAYQQSGQTGATHTTALGVRADGLRWQGIAKTYQSNQQAPAAAVGTERIVDDSFRDPTLVATPASNRIVDDSFRDTARYVAPASSGDSSLNWGDFGIGAGAMLGLALLLTVVGLGAVSMRHRAGKLGTS